MAATGFRTLVVAVTMAFSIANVSSAVDSCQNFTVCFTPDCDSLEDVARQSENSTGSVMVVVESPQIGLSELAVFNNLDRVEITGSPSTIVCVDSAGLAFDQVDNIVLLNLTFVSCGGFQNYTTEEDETRKQRSAIHAFNCKNISIGSCSFEDGIGAGVSVVNNQGGSVQITDSNFTNNSIPTEHINDYAGGGGIFVRLWENTSDFNNFLIQKCNFLNNRASSTADLRFVTSFGTTAKGTGRGGGLSIVLSGKTAHNMVRIHSCNFTANTAFFGGGLAMQLKRETYNNTLDIEDCTFQENGCPLKYDHPLAGSGGGVYFGYTTQSKSPTSGSNNHFTVINTAFLRNCAELGGGGTFFSSRSEFNTLNNTMDFISCTWDGNSARVGAAMDISPHIFERLSRGFLPTLVFDNCSFLRNSVAYKTKHSHQVFGTGTLFSSLFDIIFRSLVRFENNSGSAFIVINAIADFSACNVTFIGNTGVQGGAIALIGISSMLIGPGNTYKFIGNEASDLGGAIYSYLFDDHDFSISRSCFIQYQDLSNRYVDPHHWNAAMIFQGNSAGRYGNSIFTTSLVPCLSRTSNRTVSWLETFNWTGVFTYMDEKGGHIATDAAKFNITGTTPFHIIPGEEHSLQVLILDDLNQTVHTAYRASILREADSDVYIDVEDAFSCVAGNIIELNGTKTDDATLLLQTVTPRRSWVLVDVILSPCPPGFSLGLQNDCVCDLSYYGLTKCNHSKLYAEIRRGFWAGYVNDRLGTAVCPVHYCNFTTVSKQENTIALPQNGSELDSYICGPSRTGVICGSCSPNYTVYFHSPHYSCKEAQLCDLGALFYILSEIVPITLLFVVIMACNISFTSGTLNGFILFSQILGTLLIDKIQTFQSEATLSGFSEAYHLLYGIFNLEFFNSDIYSFCLKDNLSVLHILVLKYATIAYAFFLVIAVVLVMKYCGHKCWFVKIRTIQSSIIHGISAFIIVCYSQIVKVSLNILLPIHLRGRFGELLSTRVWLSSDVVYVSDAHLPYAIPALLCLIVVALPPLLLLAYPLSNKLLDFCGISESKPVALFSKLIPIHKLKPLLDTFQGCFKDNCRFFAGLYFLYRLVGYIVYATVTTLSEFYAYTEILLLLMLIIHAAVQPYTKRKYNALDALLLGNLVLINGLSAFGLIFNEDHIYDHSNRKNVFNISAIQVILIYLPLLYLLLCITWKICRNRCKKDFAYSSLPKTKWMKRKKSQAAIVTLDQFPPRVLGNCSYTPFTDSIRRSKPKEISAEASNAGSGQLEPQHEKGSGAVDSLDSKSKTTQPLESDAPYRHTIG